MSMQFLQKEREKLHQQLTELNDSIADLDGRIAQYQIACQHRPEGIPDTWEPLFDRDERIRGWVDPSYWHDNRYFK